MKESCFIRVNNICFESSFEREFRGPCFTDILINSSARGRAEPRSARLCAWLNADIGKLLRACPYKVGLRL